MPLEAHLGRPHRVARRLRKAVVAEIVPGQKRLARVAVANRQHHAPELLEAGVGKDVDVHAVVCNARQGTC